MDLHEASVAQAFEANGDAARSGQSLAKNISRQGILAAPILNYVESRRSESDDLIACCNWRTLTLKGFWTTFQLINMNFLCGEEIDMRSEKKRKSIWQESMRVGLPELDEERKKVFELLELLEVRPIYSISSETFARRFSVVHEAVERFLEFEEGLLEKYPVPDKTRQLHIEDHERIRMILAQVRKDSIAKKNRTGLDVYKSLRAEIESHVMAFGFDMGEHIPKAEAVSALGQRDPR